MPSSRASSRRWRKLLLSSSTRGCPAVSVAVTSCPSCHRHRTATCDNDPFAELGGQGRDGTGDLPLFRRTLVPTELPGRKASVCLAVVATLTGLEPATSAVTGRRANQLRHRALLVDPLP